MATFNTALRPRCDLQGLLYAMQLKTLFCWPPLCQVEDGQEGGEAEGGEEQDRTRLPLEHACIRGPVRRKVAAQTRSGL
jgi:hypothetical protein